LRDCAILRVSTPVPELFDFGKLSRLANIQAPTLVANGDNDIMVPTVNSYLLAGHIPNAG
jgi:pimeloyl-ACP methyl ester carboxylesterase